MATSKRGPASPLSSLHRLEFILQHKSDQLLRDELRVGFGHVQILQALHRSRPVSQREFAAKLYQTESNISRQLQALKKKGLVAISRNKKDRRLREISLTTKGNSTYQKAEKVLAAQHKELLKMTSASEVKTLDKVVAALLRVL